MRPEIQVRRALPGRPQLCLGTDGGCPGWWWPELTLHPCSPSRIPGSWEARRATDCRVWKPVVEKRGSKCARPGPGPTGSLLSAVLSPAEKVPGRHSISRDWRGSPCTPAAGCGQLVEQWPRVASQRLRAGHMGTSWTECADGRDSRVSEEAVTTCVPSEMSARPERVVKRRSGSRRCPCSGGLAERYWRAGALSQRTLSPVPAL